MNIEEQIQFHDLAKTLNKIASGVRELAEAMGCGPVEALSKATAWARARRTQPKPEDSSCPQS